METSTGPTLLGSAHRQWDVQEAFRRRPYSATGALTSRHTRITRESLWPSLGLLRPTWSGSLEVGMGLLGALCAHGPRGACWEDRNGSWHSTAVDLSVLNLSMQCSLCVCSSHGAADRAGGGSQDRKGALCTAVPAGTPSCCHSHRASNVYEICGLDLLVRSRALTLFCVQVSEACLLI